MVNQTISWYIEKEGKLQRVEEALVSISDKELTFTRNNEKFILKAETHLAPYIFGDVVFAIQRPGGILVPIRLPFLLEEPVLSQTEIEEIVKTQVQDLENKVAEAREIIKKLLSDNVETMLSKFHIFDQLGEFRQFLQEKAEHVVLKKMEVEKQVLMKKQEEELQPNSVQIPETKLNPPPEDILPGTTSPPNNGASLVSNNPVPPPLPSQNNVEANPHSQVGTNRYYRSFFAREGGKK